MKEKLKADIVKVEVKIVRDEEIPDDLNDPMMNMLDKTWAPIGVFLEATVMVHFEEKGTLQKIQSGGQWGFLTTEADPIARLIKHDRKELGRLLNTIFDIDVFSYEELSKKHSLTYKLPDNINADILNRLVKRLG